MRHEALRILHDGVKNLISFEDFEKLLSQWEVIPLMQAGELVGCFVVKGNEVHIAYVKQVFIRHHIKTIFNPLLQLCGGFNTSVRESNERGYKFCNRIGFTETNRANGIIYMQCKRLNYV